MCIWISLMKTNLSNFGWECGCLFRVLAYIYTYTNEYIYISVKVCEAQPLEHSFADSVSCSHISTIRQTLTLQQRFIYLHSTNNLKQSCARAPVRVLHSTSHLKLDAKKLVAHGKKLFGLPINKAHKSTEILNRFRFVLLLLPSTIICLYI